MEWISRGRSVVARAGEFEWIWIADAESEACASLICAAHNREMAEMLTLRLPPIPFDPPAFDLSAPFRIERITYPE